VPEALPLQPGPIAADTGKPDNRFKYRKLSDPEWHLIRSEYQTGNRFVSAAFLAKKHGISKGELEKRMAGEKWKKGKIVVDQARAALEQATEKALAVEMERRAPELAKAIADDLQPWIEVEKKAWTKATVKRAKAARKRLDALAKGYTVFDKDGNPLDQLPTPKDEQHFATAEEKWDGITRRTLGMGESDAQKGSISLRMLTGTTAIEVKVER
jgi:hypothetical protein